MSDQDEKQEIHYMLQSPFEYAHHGATREAVFIALSPPTSRNLDEVGYMKQAFFKAIGSLDTDDTPEDVDKGKDPQDLEGSDIMATLAICPEVDYSQMLAVGRKLLVHGRVAMIDGEERLTGPLMEKVSYDDLEGLVGAYLVGFPLRSTLAKAATV